MINWGESIHPSNTALKWLPMDTEERYKKHLSQADTREMLEQFGWIDCEITYSFNEYGFRCDTFDHKCEILFNGCSMVEGIGLPLEQTWAKQVADHLNIPYHSIAISGSDWQYATQRTVAWVPKLKPKILMIKEPPACRLSWWTDENENISFDIEDPEIMRDYIDLIATEKNQKWWRYSMKELTRKVCNENSCKPIFIPPFCLNKYGGAPENCARDLAHPGIIEQNYTKELVIKKIEENDRM